MRQWCRFTKNRPPIIWAKGPNDQQIIMGLLVSIGVNTIGEGIPAKLVADGLAKCHIFIIVAQVSSHNDSRKGYTLHQYTSGESRWRRFTVEGNINLDV